MNQRLSRLHLLLSLSELVPGDRAGCLRSLLQTIVRTLRGGQLRLRLQPIRVGGLDLRLSFGDLGLHFGSTELRKQLPLFYNAATINQHSVHIATHSCAYRNALKR